MAAGEIKTRVDVSQAVRDTVKDKVKGKARKEMAKTFDASDFDSKFRKIAKNVVPELIEKGMGRAMLDLMNDCIMEVPTVPLKEGWLRGSASVFVQNKLIATGEGFPNAKGGKANKSHHESISVDKFVGVIGFNTPYAARVHEVPMNFTEPSSGNKYLESKIITKKKHYIKVIANTIKAGHA